MDQKSLNQQYITDLIGVIKGEKTECLDFDEMVIKLEEWHETLTHTDNTAGELSVLRQDYIDRISGMVKAIGAVNGKRQELEAAIKFIESLDSQSAAELCSLYRKIQAKFQDVFPGSFGLLNRYHNKARVKKTDFEMFK